MSTVPVRVVPRGFGQHGAAGCVVGDAGGGVHGVVGLRRLRDVGGVPGRALHLRPVSVAVLLARAVRRLAARLVRAEAVDRGRRGCRSRRRCSSCRSRASSASPATTIAAPTTRRSGPTRRRAPSASRASSYRGERSFPLILQNVHRYFLYVALLFLVVLALRRVEGAVVHRPGDGPARPSASASARSCWPPTSSCSAATRSAATRCATSSAASCDEMSQRRPARPALRLRQLPEPPAHGVGLVQPGLGGVRGHLRPPVLDGHLDRLEDLSEWRRLSTSATTTTSSSSAPAAPACAPRSRRPPAGVSVGLVCKSLLGKAHTVMAEGGIAAALANVDDRDNWQVHFADTMRGGQYVNNWRMAELHAQEAPDRVRELEAWGAVFDRTPDGRILQRNFGGHRYPAPRARRRSHRPRDDPHAAGSRHPPRHHRAHGVHGRRPAHATASASTGRVRLRARARPVRASSAPRPSSSPPAASAAPIKITSNSWEGTGDGHALAYRAGADADRHGVRPVPSDRDGLAAQRAGHPGHRGRARRRRRPAQQQGRAVHVRRHPRELPRRRPPTTRKRAGATRRATRTRAARRSCSRATTSRAASVREVREGRGSPHGGVFLDISWIKAKLPNAEEHIKRKLPSMYHQFKELADIDITKEPMEVGPTTHYIMGGVQVDADTQMSTVPGLFAAGECAGGHQRRQPPRRQLALRPPRVRQARRRVRGAASRARRPPRTISDGQVEAAATTALAPFDRGAERRDPVQGAAGPAGD